MMEDKKALLEERKRKILQVIKEKGPLLPLQVAREIGMQSLFTSAILSEMVFSKQLKVSNLKIGDSPLFFLPEQQQEIEKFSSHFGGKEKEVFELLKKQGILDEEKLHPAHRVAIKSIKDFAISFKSNIDGQEKLFWKFYSLSQEEISKKLSVIEKQEKKEKREKKVTPRIEKKLLVGEKEKKSSMPTSAVSDTDFIIKLDSYLKKNNIQVLEKRSAKKKEACYVVRLATGIGEIDLLLIAKDKKTIGDTDIMTAFSQGQAAKLPVLFLSSGKIGKKVSAIENFKNSLIFKHLD